MARFLTPTRSWEILHLGLLFFFRVFVLSQFLMVQLDGLRYMLARSLFFYILCFYKRECEMDKILTNKDEK